MAQTLMIDNLEYEEIVLLQTILMDVVLDQERHTVDYDSEILDSLYEKVMNA